MVWVWEVVVTVWEVGNDRHPVGSGVSASSYRKSKISDARVGIGVLVSSYGEWEMIVTVWEVRDGRSLYGDNKSRAAKSRDQPCDRQTHLIP